MLPILSRLRTARARRWRRKAPATTFAAMLLVVPMTVEYVVKPGDTVWWIARTHDSTVEAIVEANDLPYGGRLIYPGDVLKIPSAHPRGGRQDRREIERRPAARHRPLADADRRRIVIHTVRRGDTLSELANRYHAWTSELIRSNGGSTTLQIGQRLRVPVVVRAAQLANRASRAAERRALHTGTEAQRRAAVRRLVTRTATRHGVDPQLALAVAWQESGWQQDVVSSANAIGVMQVIPSTGRWMSDVTGRRLDLRDAEDNVFAGVALLKFLTDRTSTRRALAGYYQGLAGVRRHGMYDDTKRYVANVLAIKRSFEKGHYPY
jgi:LysM repeat protein